MGQIKVIHEHYDRSPLVSILAGVLLIGHAILRLFDDEITKTSIILVGVTVLPLLVIVIIGIIRRNKPSLVVYNDRIEVKAPSKYSKKINEILYSDIKNLAFESGQLLIWLDESSTPMYCNLGANTGNAQATYDILRSTYDKYNQEHNITPAKVDFLPKRNKPLIMAITILIMVGIMILLFISR
jgi:hypothetical protein